MKLKETISSLFWLIIGLAVSYAGHELGIGEIHDPNSGFMIFWAGIIMTGLSLAILIQSLRMKEPNAEETSFRSRGQWKDVLIILLFLFLYTFAFDRLGFIFSTFLLLIVLFRIIEPMRWVYVVIGSLFITIFVYGLFDFLLEIQLPKGLLGF